MKGKRFPWLDLYCTGYTNDVRWFLYCEKSDSVPEHGEEWGYELLTNGPTVRQNGLIGRDTAILRMAHDIHGDHKVPGVLGVWKNIWDTCENASLT
jgi:hypothetical protein